MIFYATIRSTQKPTPQAARVDAPSQDAAVKMLEQQGYTVLSIASENPAPSATAPCPFCMETILVGAKKCKHCGEWLDKATPAAAPVLEKTKEQVESKNHQWFKEQTAQYQEQKKAADPAPEKAREEDRSPLENLATAANRTTAKPKPTQTSLHNPGFLIVGILLLPVGIGVCIICYGGSTACCGIPVGAIVAILGLGFISAGFTDPAVAAAKKPGISLNRGSSQILCPHCQQRGGVRTKLIKRRKGISGGRAIAALMTGGLSLPFAGISRKEMETEASCSNCGAIWHYG